MVDTNDVFLMHANKMIGGEFFEELLKAFSYSKTSAIYQLNTYIVLFHGRVDDLLF
ncbi:hypothetical protein C7475_1197 [Chitinophaga sp. S165]|nr:hypothetical protein C7475_1197 [Chitinophaga sp. S165]